MFVQTYITQKESVVLKTYFNSEVLEYLGDKISNSPRHTKWYDAEECLPTLSPLNFPDSTMRINLHFPRNYVLQM